MRYLITFEHPSILLSVVLTEPPLRLFGPQEMYIKYTSISNEYVKHVHLYRRFPSVTHLLSLKHFVRDQEVLRPVQAEQFYQRNLQRI